MEQRIDIAPDALGRAPIEKLQRDERRQRGTG
jgi:hypothetical protein